MFWEHVTIRQMMRLITRPRPEGGNWAREPISARRRSVRLLPEMSRLRPDRPRRRSAGRRGLPRVLPADPRARPPLAGEPGADLISRVVGFGGVTTHCPGEDQEDSAQFSIERPGTRRKSRVLRVTRIASFWYCLSLNLGIGKRSSGYWSHLQRGAQIVFNLTSARRRLKLF
jgi:hypothetical protein